MTNPADLTVCVHAWRWIADPQGMSQEHCDPDDEPDGWCVYTRHDFDQDPADGIPFELVDEADFDTEAEAMAEAERRAAALRCKLQTY